MPQRSTGGPERMTPRPGPRPLAMHLSIACLSWIASRGAWTLSRSGWPPWSLLRAGADGPRRAEIDAVLDGLRRADPEAFARALDGEMARRQSALLAGIAAYQAHPYRRDVSDPPAVWRAGAAQLLDYGATAPDLPADAPPVLMVPSLINRGYILDLSSDCSFARFLAGSGVRPYLLDWGTPGPEERAFTLTDYVAGHLADALDRVTGAAGGPATVLGYCMGGTLALALAQLHPARVRRLALLAAPWDFHAGAASRVASLPAVAHACSWQIESWGELPVDTLQALFATLDPMLAVRKFTRFAALAPDSVAARAFVALEDWINDGVPLAAHVARECLFGWYGGNTPAAGRWRIAGRPVRPSRVTCPTLAVIPGQDRIVPPDSARAAADAIPGCETLTPTLGHIGMIASARARRDLWPRLAAWLAG